MKKTSKKGTIWTATNDGEETISYSFNSFCWSIFIYVQVHCRVFVDMYFRIEQSCLTPEAPTSQNDSFFGVWPLKSNIKNKNNFLNSNKKICSNSFMRITYQKKGLSTDEKLCHLFIQIIFRI
ncbi:hypothetical protein BpHYR1_042354 [Brachionus plicatilis]|uniref:Uncharacterized protein n=1 Tax=Brachionus plicatilis TaxID=10195 RepID=A0A3M7SV69_BRAPC|nr:hypothetical protein BpHYR1_042354 [Brachionus plicatilis]